MILDKKSIINKLSFYILFYNVSKELMKCNSTEDQRFGTSFLKYIIESVLEVLHISKNDVANYCNNFGYYFTKNPRTIDDKLFRIYFDLDLNRIYIDKIVFFVNIKQIICMN